MTETRQQEEVVRLIATTKKYERAPYFMAPQLGADRKPVYYFETDSSLDDATKEAFKAALNFSEISDEDKDGVIKLQHLMQLNMRIPRDRALFFYIKNLPDSLGIVAKNKNSANPAKHRFYIENKESEGAAIITRMALKKKAMDIADSICAAESAENDSVRDALRLIGIPVKGLTNTLAQSALLTEADTNPKRFIDILGDKYRDYKIFIVKCIEKGILFKSKSGSFAYNTQDNIIAMNEHQMISFLQDKANDHLVRMWADTLNDNRLSDKQTFEPAVDSSNEKKMSKRMNVKEAITYIEGLTVSDEIRGFISGEERPAVLQVANKKIDSLTN